MEKLSTLYEVCFLDLEMKDNWWSWKTWKTVKEQQNHRV